MVLNNISVAKMTKKSSIGFLKKYMSLESNLVPLKDKIFRVWGNSSVQAFPGTGGG